MTTTTSETITMPLTIGQVDSSFRPLTLSDRCDFERWARDIVLEALIGTGKLDAKTMAEAAFASLGLGWNSAEVQQLACSQRGITHLIWLATRGSHRFTPEQVAQ